jgi:hypothetical protein
VQAFHAVGKEANWLKRLGIEIVIGWMLASSEAGSEIVEIRKHSITMFKSPPLALFFDQPLCASDKRLFSSRESRGDPRPRYPAPHSVAFNYLDRRKTEVHRHSQAMRAFNQWSLETELD